MELTADLPFYAALFASAVASATLLPGTSEAALIGLLATDRGAPLVLLLTATAGNVLGSTVNWALGRFLSGMRDRWWFPVKERAYQRAVAWNNRYGVWALLLSSAPLVGDALTLAAGALGVSLPRFLVLVTIAKGARYLFIVAGFLWWSGGA